MGRNQDSETIASALTGDIYGFTKLCDKYYPVLVALAFSILGDHHLPKMWPRRP